jgi:hypothetical protein
MRNAAKECGADIHSMFLAVGMVVALVGGILTVSIIGAIVGLSLLSIAWPLPKNPVVPGPVHESVLMDRQWAGATCFVASDRGRRGCHLR